MIKLDYSLVVTIFYILIVYAFMSRFFFKPIVRVLQQRRELIEGRIAAAKEAVSNADRKTAEYEQVIRNAKAETFRRQEAQREKALSERTDLLSRAKQDADIHVREAKSRLQAEAEVARTKLDVEVDLLAKQLTAAILQDRP
jgi:F-type H+-transporting ATPase subunit b